MGIISYAQNFEDVLLWRALGDVANGFWIDVGAADPDAFSVTRAFSEHGWRGINIEPTPAAFARLQARRPNDINLGVALGATAGRMAFYECADPTLSSLDPAIAARNCAAGRAVTEHEVEVTTLAAVWERHAAGDVHFLKIDVEGTEAAVLAGGDFVRFRPWLVVVEATVPMSQEPNYAGFDPGLLAADYRFAWFDGINRFYVAAEQWARLGRYFTVPVNVFDAYELYDPAAAEREAALARLAAAGDELAQLRPELERLRDEVSALTVRLRATPGGRLRRLLQRVRTGLSPNR